MAATWFNRYPIEQIEREWNAAWDYYADEVLPRAVEILRVEDFEGPVVKPYPQDKGAKTAYLKGDMETYFSLVPQALVDYALRLTHNLRNAA